MGILVLFAFGWWLLYNLHMNKPALIYAIIVSIIIGIIAMVLALIFLDFWDIFWNHSYLTVLSGFG